MLIYVFDIISKRDEIWSLILLYVYFFHFFFHNEREDELRYIHSENWPTSAF